MILTAVSIKVTISKVSPCVFWCLGFGRHLCSVSLCLSSLSLSLSLQVKSNVDRLCGLVVRVSGYRYRGPGFDPRRYQIF